MINNELEMFTAQEAISAGLVDAVKDGSAVVSGRYKLNSDTTVGFDKNNFVFKDRSGNLRVGNFKDDRELLTFFEIPGDKRNADTN